MSSPETPPQRGPREVLAELPAGPARDAVQAVLAELDVAQARARELDTAQAEREVRRLVQGDRSRFGRAVTLVLDELDRVRGTTPATPLRRIPASAPPPEPAPPGDQPA